MEYTLDCVINYDPDRLAVYSYAHVPWMRPSQKALERYPRPEADEKLQLHRCIIERLTGAGYLYIGMDHFAKEEDELAQAFRQGRLQRNFQGYSTRAGVDIAAFGMTGISQSQSVYWQNHKNIVSYQGTLKGGRLPIERGYLLTKDDKLRRDVIMDIMCKLHLDFSDIESKHEIRFRDYFAGQLERLCEFEDDGLLEIQTEKMTITQKGRLFLRNIAMQFDVHSHASKQQFSRTL
ncbi:hypothetical protein IID24_02620 [Patescibacteria group bacterium]|nr:hypothetical protein [Patescibacteria group bacterium]